MDILKDIENAVDLVEYSDQDFDVIHEAIQNTTDKINTGEFIKEWFESPFVSDYDKNKIREYLNKKP